MTCLLTSTCKIASVQLVNTCNTSFLLNLTSKAINIQQRAVPQFGHQDRYLLTKQTGAPQDPGHVFQVDHVLHDQIGIQKTYGKKKISTLWLSFIILQSKWYKANFERCAYCSKMSNGSLKKPSPGAPPPCFNPSSPYVS
jgi:hypothetical protein